LESKRAKLALSGRGKREVAQTMYTHVSKCKTIKKENK
jgi:hypothetical protein